jgi:hypothetical protein
MQIKDKLYEELVQQKQKTESVLNETIRIQNNEIKDLKLNHLVFYILFYIPVIICIL